MLARIAGRLAALGGGSTVGWFGSDPQPELDEAGSLRRLPYTHRLETEGYREIPGSSPEFHRRQMWPAGVLRDKGLIEDGPLIMRRDDRIVALYRLGPHVRGSIQDGVCTSLLDECLASCAFESLPHKLGVTATLQMQEVAPLPADGSVVALRAGIEQTADLPIPEKPSRKAWAYGELWSICPDGTSRAGLISRGRVLMIEPRWARYVSWFC